MKVIITGASGMIGSEVVRQAILDPDIELVTAILRKPIDIRHPKLNIVIHYNFLDYTNLYEIFRQHDACLWCLGTSQNKVRSKDEYYTITYDFVIAAAKAMLKSNPMIRFLFISGMGADPSMKSRIFFARIKGKAENELKKLSFKHLYIVRPGGIMPVHRNSEEIWQQKIMYPFYILFKWIIPSLIITSAEFAHEILKIIKYGSRKTLLENRDLLPQDKLLSMM